MEKIKNIEALEKTLFRIWEKELPIDQGVFFSEKGCCLAGWLFYEFSGSGYSMDDLIEQEQIYFSPNIFREDFSPCILTWVDDFLGITNVEKYLLINSVVDKLSHQAMLEFFKKGKRISRDLLEDSVHTLRTKSPREESLDYFVPKPFYLTHIVKSLDEPDNYYLGLKEIFGDYYEIENKVSFRKADLTLIPKKGIGNA